MVSLATRVDKKGFWYLVEAGEGCDFTCSYIVIGTGGRQGSGEIQGGSTNAGQWQYVEIGFPVMHVGITDLQILGRLPDGSLAQRSLPRAEGLSRRQAVRALASTLLTGGALMMFPAALARGQALADDRRGSEPYRNPDAGLGAFNPYGAEAEDFYRPY